MQQPPVESIPVPPRPPVHSPLYSPEYSPEGARVPTPPLPSGGGVQRRAAKWPPDDDGEPVQRGRGGNPGGAGGGGFDPGEGDFKRGKLKPVVAVLLLAAAAAGVGGFMLLNAGQDQQELTPEKVELLKSGTAILPKADQLAEYRRWLREGHTDLLVEEALKRVAWAKDSESLPQVVSFLSSKTQKLRAQAALALMEYGAEAAPTARPALLKALQEAQPESRPQIAWALVELGEDSAFDEVLKLYRAGHLSTVRRLDGSIAFDPQKIAALVSLDKLVELHTDPSAGVRQLVASVLSRNPSAKYADTLIALVRDPDREIASQAAPGLGALGDPRSVQPLVEQLKGVDAQEKKAFLEALRDGVGTAGLMLALNAVSTETPTKEWHQTNQVFTMVRELADPKGGDALARYLEQRGHGIHWQTEAALALAEIGDLRAVPTLAARLRMDDDKIYGNDTDYELRLKRDGKERVEVARMLADLAELHPEAREQMRSQAEDALLFWVTETPSPHANGLRALVNIGSSEGITRIRKWANPKIKLPLEGQSSPMPQEWIVAQSALRYAGKAQDKASWPVLVGAFKRRPEHVDATMPSLQAGGLAILGMTLRGLGVGAAQGLAEWGDPKGVAPLLAYIESTKENEQSRQEACAALSWVSTAKDFVTVAEKIRQYAGASPQDQVRQACFLETLVTRPIAGTAPALLQFLNPDFSFAVRHAAARAIGKAGLDAPTVTQLFELIKDTRMMNDAVLTLMLGADPDTAARALASLSGQPQSVRDELQELWYQSFGFWSREDLEQGHLFRFVANAENASRVSLDGVPQAWVSEQLRRQFENLQYDNGPHSFTRVVLRSRLLQMALGSDAAVRTGAIRTLRFLGERGVLLSLQNEKGEVGPLAREAFHRLRYPVAAAGVRSFEKSK
jgi:HEAT repeat protein